MGREITRGARAVDNFFNPTPPETVRVREREAQVAQSVVVQAAQQEAAAAATSAAAARAALEQAASTIIKAPAAAPAAAPAPTIAAAPPPVALPDTDAPQASPSPTMPDPDSPEAIEAARKAAALGRARAGRSSTILTAPGERSPSGRSARRSGYASRTLG